MENISKIVSLSLLCALAASAPMQAGVRASNLVGRGLVLGCNLAITSLKIKGFYHLIKAKIIMNRRHYNTTDSRENVTKSLKSFGFAALIYSTSRCCLFCFNVWSSVLISICNTATSLA